MGGNSPGIEQVPIGSLRPDPRNPRRMGRHEGEALKRSLAEYGAVEPAVVNVDGTIIGGHMRVEAAKLLGWSEFPVVRVELSDEKARLLNLALNRIHGEWDEDRLAEMLWELRDEDADLALSGFESGELERLLASVGGVDGDTEPIEPPTEPRTKPGDLWVLGEHRLLCGDATVDTDVSRLMGGGVADLMVTDPPYGVNLDLTWRGAVTAPLGENRAGKVVGDDRCDWRAAWQLAGASVAYVWHAGMAASAVQESLVASGFLIRAQIIWAKPVAAMSRGHYHWKHEPCWYAVRKGASGGWAGDRKQTTVWEAAPPNQIFAGSTDERTEHPTQKPLELAARAIGNHTSEAVYDPFAGSGTTLIACENLHRRCYAMEIDPGYCDVIVDRWERHTGKEPIRGRTADEVLA